MRGSTFESKSIFSRTSHVAHSNLILGSTQITHVELRPSSNVELFMCRTSKIDFFINYEKTALHFSPSLAARAKMSLSRAQNIFMPANINFIVIVNEL